MESPVSVQEQSLVSVQAQSPASIKAQSPVSMQAQSPVSMQAYENQSKIVHERENMKSKFTQFQHKQAQQPQFQLSSLTQIEAIDLVDNPLANDDKNVNTGSLMRLY